MRIFRDLNNAGNSAHTVRIEIERQSNSQNTLRFYWNGALQQETSTATAGGALSAFTNFIIGTGSTELDLRIDDVTVTVPAAGGGGEIPINLTARLIDWTQAGVEGRISHYTNVIDFIAAGGDNSGLSDNAPLLQSLVDGLTTDTVIYFPAGTYRFENRINFRSSSSRSLPGVIIRGAGTRLTKILFMDPQAEDAGLFEIAGLADGSAKNITGGLTRGSTAITLSPVSDLAVGDWLWIRQDNDPRRDGNDPRYSRIRIDHRQRRRSARARPS